MFKNASCLGEPTIWWFPERGNRSGAELREIFSNAKKATTICNSCPCINECLKYSLDNYEIGIWGGMGEILRRKARRMHENGIPISVIRKKLLGIKAV